MPATLIALYRRPEGGEEALETFRQRYREEHLPLVRQTPGLRSVEVHRVAQALTESELVMVTLMGFDDRASLDEGLRSDVMGQAGRNLREIGPDLATLLVLEPDGSMEPVPGRQPEREIDVP
jgi:uncharacterized protein (TIGR02118 family)